jgi:hypothetical protein
MVKIYTISPQPSKFVRQLIKDVLFVTIKYSMIYNAVFKREKFQTNDSPSEGQGW